MTDDLEVVSKDTLNKILEMQIRIEKLEAALREIAAPDWIYDGAGLRDMARKALEGKDD